MEKALGILASKGSKSGDILSTGADLDEIGKKKANKKTGGATNDKEIEELVESLGFGEHSDMMSSLMKMTKDVVGKKSTKKK